MKRIIAILLSVLFVCALPICCFAADPPELSNCQAAMLYNVENGKILYSQNADMALPPASTVKLMTALVAYEALSERIDEEIIVTSPMIRSVTGNYIGLKKDEKIKIDDLFYGLLLRGANDAAHALAITAYGSLEDFVVKMNERAETLGMVNTVYKNVTGMHASDMTTTPEDTLIVASEFFKIDYLMDVSSTVKHIVEPTNLVGTRNLYNRNYLISKYSETRYFYSYARGMNSGSTSEAGYCCVSSASDGGLSYIALVMGAGEVDGVNYAFENVGKLLRYGINSYGYVELIDSSLAGCEVPVTLSDDSDHVVLVPSENLIAFMPLDVDLKKDVKFSYLLEYETLEAPVKEGQVVGRVGVSVGDELIGHVDLVTKHSVARSELQYFFSRVEKITSSPIFAATIITAILLTAAYFTLGYLKRRHKSKRRGKYYIN